MKAIIVFTAFLAVAVALPRLQRRQVNFDSTTYSRSKPVEGLGQDNYIFRYSQTDGQTRDEAAQIGVNYNGEPVLRVQGAYSYVSPDNGQLITVTYYADENGFQPTGNHIPVAPTV